LTEVAHKEEAPGAQGAFSAKTTLGSRKTEPRATNTKIKDVSQIENFDLRIIRMQKVYYGIYGTIT
jgi:hypothetical protein